MATCKKRKIEKTFYTLNLTQEEFSNLYEVLLRYTKNFYPNACSETTAIKTIYAALFTQL